VKRVSPTGSQTPNTNLNKYFLAHFASIKSMLILSRQKDRQNGQIKLFGINKTMVIYHVDLCLL